MIVYMDKKGNEVFDGKEYWEATPFHDGYAIVQETDKNGPWKVIDHTGKVSGTFSTDYAPYIQSAEPFYEGLALVTLKRPKGYDRKSHVYEMIYFNHKAEPVIRLKDVVGTYGRMNCGNFTHGLVGCYTSGKYHFFNTVGETVLEIPNTRGVLGIYPKYILIRGSNHVDYIVDRNTGALSKVLDKKHTVYSVNPGYEDYIIAIAMDTVTKEKMSYVIGTEKLDTIAKTPDRIIGMLSDNYITGMLNGYKIVLSEVRSIDGKTIYQLSPENREFMSLAEALKYEDKVRTLNLTREKSVDGIEKLINLEHLSLYGFDMNVFPDVFDRFSQLKTLRFSENANLVALPNSIITCKQLTRLSIDNCKQVKNLEEIIIAMPQLKKVRTTNYEFKDGFLQQMKDERPQLTIENWFQSEPETHEEVIDLEVMEEAPPAPVRKR